MPSKDQEKSGMKREKTTLRLLDQDGTMLVFRVKRDVKFKKILKAFSDKVEKDLNEFRLLWRGRDVDLGLSPNDLDGFDDEEEIEVVASQVGG